ncbi:MAG TPA: YegP family protein [Candidatus Sumerlaeota bacterium]|nr:YegP family protein [Candidatus Sumerlaeota bacterium]HMZ52225.1 YegP family protein [Candidatus Sumerlaeota bacterium]HNM47462.1 YegP family protein [Candidatus Sumerlaeota bacterium]
MGYYKLKKGDSGKYHWNLHAGNHEIILTSESYNAKSSAENGIKSCQENSPKDERYIRKIDARGNPYFVLTAGNSEIIGKSESYTSESARDNGIESCKKNGPTTDIKDEA